jgi:hypothetical protein
LKVRIVKVVGPPAFETAIVKGHALPTFVTGAGVIVTETLEFVVLPVTVTLTVPLDAPKGGVPELTPE